IGLLAGVLAVPSGLLLAAVLVFVINRRSFGWTMSIDPSPGILLQGVALSLLAALLAGLYPAWRMAGAAPAESLRDEEIGTGCGRRRHGVDRCAGGVLPCWPACADQRHRRRA